MARQKKPLNVYTEDNVLTMAQTSVPVVEEYLDMTSFTKRSTIGNRHRKVYQYIRDVMVDSLLDKQKKDPLYAALIERIARMTMILDSVEKKLFSEIPNMNENDIVQKLGGNYLNYLKEYRSIIQSYSDLRWAGDQVQKTKSVEKVREITREIQDEV